MSVPTSTLRMPISRNSATLKDKPGNCDGGIGQAQARVDVYGVAAEGLDRLNRLLDPLSKYAME